MKVSIIVPIYGVERYIAQCAKSLFEQTFDSIEYIFVNDCTDDRSINILEDIIKLYPNRRGNIKIIHHKFNQGLAAARKTGIFNSTGKYILHVDSDDWLDVTAIEMLYNKAEMTNADIVVYDVRHVYKHHFIDESNAVYDSQTTYLCSILERKTSVNLVTKFCKASLCRLADALPIPGLNYGEDYAVLPRIVYYAKKIVKLDAVLYYYNHLNERSYTNNVTRANVDQLQKVLEIHKTFFDTKLDKEKYQASLAVARIINNNIIITTCQERDLDNLLHESNVYLPARLMCRLPIKHKLLYFMIRYSLRQWLRLYRYLRVRRNI